MTYDDIYTEERMHQEKSDLEQWHIRNDERIDTILQFTNMVMREKQHNLAEKLVLLMRQEEISDIFENSAILVYVYLSAMCYQDERANGFAPSVYEICNDVADMIQMFSQLRFFFWENIYEIEDTTQQLRQYIMDKHISNSVVYYAMTSAFKDEPEGLDFLIQLFDRDEERQTYFQKMKQYKTNEKVRESHE